ncbi:BREX-1 system adenine-specific DNA-methyltransferase PglX [Schnuerera ultunensis]|uniref:site-specific DNA-methyltransferase (adenine-specific) n=1 Tax=[Clostridium] ultunense Esp TaxID=1288971 RepID=A0A1M4PPJ4_9FIRM|nr:BREX-1 system adenine-specific DNA-methyltransferase PglX [Schnuerera ultunensis]SHD77394.1 conserved protein of unknown function [[Clostridium] ultunense Esp]
MNAEQKKTIKSTILECREILEKDIEQVLINYGIYINKVWVNLRDLRNLTEEQENNRKNIEKAIEKFEKGGFEKDKAVMEYIKEVSYTYLNRLAALRVMEVRGLIDEILVPRGEHGNRSFIGSRFYEVAREFCKYEMDGGLGYLLNIMFEEISEEIKMLFNTEDEYSFVTPSSTSLLKVIELLCTNIDEESWGQDEIIGWIYQYFNEKEKEDVFDRLYNKKQKIKVEDIPAATQLFTPDWIVDWIVDNSLGSLWNEIKQGKREDKKVEDVKLLDPCCGSGHFLVKAYDLFYDMYVEEGIYSKEEIPYKILENNIYGIDIDLRAVQLTGLILFIKTKSILKDNGYDTNTKDKLSVNLVCADSILLNGSRLEDLKEKHKGNKTILKMIEIIYEEFEDVRLKGSLIQPEKKLFPLFEEFKNRLAKKELSKAKRTKRKQTKGQESLLKEQSTSLSDYKSQRDFTKEERELMSSLDAIYSEAIKANDISRQLFASEAQKSVKLVDIFMKQYDVVVTNPPYMGKRSMNDKLKDYLSKSYSVNSSDLYSVFILRCLEFLDKNGRVGMITQDSFMFISEFDKLREFILNNSFIEKVLHLGPHAFEEIKGEKVRTVSFVLNKQMNKSNFGEYIRLTLFKSAQEKKNKLNELLRKKDENYCFSVNQERFAKIDKQPFLYMLNEEMLELFQKSSFGTYADVTGSQHKTANNSKYLKYFWEVSKDTIGLGKRWILYSKGGEYKRYFGNWNLIVDWSEEARHFYKNNKTSNLLKEDYWYKKGICYSANAGENFNARFMPKNCIFDMKGPAIFVEDDMINYTLGYINSKFCNYIMNLLNPTVSYQATDLRRLPWKEPSKIIKNIVEELVEENILLAKEISSYDETEYFFESPPLMKYKRDSIIESFTEYYFDTMYKKAQILVNDGKIDTEIFNIYEIKNTLQEEIFYEVGKSEGLYNGNNYNENEVCNFIKENNIKERYFFSTLGEKFDINPVDVVDIIKKYNIYKKKELQSEVENLLSYLIGCILGNWESNLTVIKDDGILPVSSTIYLEEDIIEKIYVCIQKLYGEECGDSIFDEIEQILGKPLEDYLIKDFYNSHVTKYKKRPIYWHICSPKKTFNCFIYYHKLDNDTLYKVKSIYLNQMISRYEEDLKYYTNQLIEARTNGDKSKEKDFKDKCSDLEAKLEDLNILDKKIMEILPYEPNIDEGVLYNIIPIEPILSAPVATKRERDKYYEEVGK